MPSPRRAFSPLHVTASIAVCGVLIGVAIPSGVSALTESRVARAADELRLLKTRIQAAPKLPRTLADIGSDGALDPWGRPYVYVRSAASPTPASGGMVRVDHFGVPLNTDFDLYSVGKDGRSAASLSVKESADDVIVANDGGFIGLASRY